MNILTEEKQHAIEILIRKGVSHREIERKTGIDRKTIRKYAQKGQQKEIITGSKSPMATGSETKGDSKSPTWPPGEEWKSSRQSACEIHGEWIRKQIELGRNATAIYQDLVDKLGYKNKYNSVKRFVHKIRKKNPKQFDRLEFLPGEEAQVDYGQGAKARYVGGKCKTPRLFVMTLKYSGRSFRKVVWKSSQKGWAKLHEEAFRYLGGSPQYVVLDNLKEGVLKADIYEPELNPLYESVLAHYQVIADPARVRDPNRKGTVENAIQHTQSTALKGRIFESIEEQNQFLVHWEEKWASTRIHGRKKRQVEALYQEEKPYLQPLPLSGFQYFDQEIRTVSDDGTIQVGQCYYSALPALIHSKIIVRIYDNGIAIINPKTLEVIRRHSKGRYAGEVKMEEKDRIFNPSRQTQYLLIKAGQIGPETLKLCKQLFEEYGRPGQRRIQGIVNLARRYAVIDIESTSKKANEVGLKSYQALRRLVEQISVTASDKLTKTVA